MTSQCSLDGLSARFAAGDRLTDAEEECLRSEMSERDWRGLVRQRTLAAIQELSHVRTMQCDHRDYVTGLRHRGDRERELKGRPVR